MTALSGVDEALLGDSVSFSFDVADPEVMPDPVVSGEEDSVVSQHMDIREPLSSLKLRLERRLGAELSGHEFWLQDRERLEEGMTLVEQCVQGEGTVQINCEVKTDPDTGRGRINIVDVLKPVTDEPSEEERSDSEEVEPPGGGAANRDCVTRWVVCTQFRQAILTIF